VKDSVKKAVEFVESFEETAIDMAFEEGYDAVFCGHIHKASIRTVKRAKRSVTYYNSGDWVENLTALEFDGQNWQLFQFDRDFEQRQRDMEQYTATTIRIKQRTVEHAA
ncbi:hypothetical protein RZS08_30830, partial [Arthrospira platensis SPKY1]|nr:hypothetical protein [Arthrospira platensis SPKY1]